jgi:hypothetical protein
MRFLRPLSEHILLNWVKMKVYVKNFLKIIARTQWQSMCVSRTCHKYGSKLNLNYVMSYKGKEDVCYVKKKMGHVSPKSETALLV